MLFKIYEHSFLTQFLEHQPLQTKNDIQTGKWTKIRLQIVISLKNKGKLPRVLSSFYVQIQYRSKDSITRRAWMWSAVSLCSGSRVEPNWLAAHIKEADFSPKSLLMSSCTVAKGGLSLPFTCPISSSKNSPHFNLIRSKRCWPSVSIRLAKKRPQPRQTNIQKPWLLTHFSKKTSLHILRKWKWATGHSSTKPRIKENMGFLSRLVWCTSRKMELPMIKTQGFGRTK